MKPFGKLLLKFLLLLGILLLFSACGGGTPNDYNNYDDNDNSGDFENDVDEEEPIETTEEDTEEPVSPTGITIQILIEEGILEKEYLTSLFDLYTDQFGHDIELIATPTLREILNTRIAANDPPDATLLRYNQTAYYYNMGALQSLEELPPWDFIQDAEQSNKLDGNFYGVPWLRQGCALTYLNLVALQKNPTQIAALNNLFEFLTSPEIQADILENTGGKIWTPTLYDESETAGCPAESNDLIGLRINPDHTGDMEQSVRENIVPLGKVYEIEFNIRDSAALWNPENPEYLISSAAALEPYIAPTASLFLQDNSYYYLGGFYTGAELQADNEIIPPGGYVVSCPQNPESQEQCKLQSPNSDPIWVMPEIAVSTPHSEITSTMFVEGSFKICWWVDGVQYCIRFGR